MIIETSDNRFYRVEETEYGELHHVWYGTEMKRAKGAFVPKKHARIQLVRKAATRIVQAA